MQNITLYQLENNPNLSEPFDTEFSYTQITIYDITFKEASLLLEKAENIRSSFSNPFKNLFNYSECESLIEGIQAWVYALSANFQGRIVEAGLKFENQNPYIRVLVDLSKSDCGIFYENLKILLRVSFEARANLLEIMQNLEKLGNRADGFFNTIRSEALKLDLNSICSSIIRRNITQNIQKISNSYQKIKNLDLIFKSFEQDKTHFCQLCNNLLINSDEIGLRGWYEKRLCPKQFKDFVNPSEFLMKLVENDQETNFSEKLDKEKTISEFYDNKTDEILVKIVESNNIPELYPPTIDFDEFDQNNSNSMAILNSETKKSYQIEEKNDTIFGIFPLMIPFNCLKINNETTNSNGMPDEAIFLNRRVSLKCLQMEANLIPLLLSELNTMHALKEYSFVNYLGFSFINEPLSVYLISDVLQFNLHDLLFKHKKEFTIIEKIDICQDILKGLDILNKMDLVHGNLTTKNILMNNSFKPYISDYGISKLIKRKKINKFDSLEFIKSGKLHKNQDIYSFGVIFYELFSEKEASFGYKEEEISKEKRIINFFDKNMRMGKDIDEIIEKCIETEEHKKPKPYEIIFMIGKLKKIK